MGGIIWVQRTRPEIGFLVSILASKLDVLEILDVISLNNIVWYIIETSDRALFFPRLQITAPLFVMGISDAGLATRVDLSSQGARLVGLMTNESNQICPVEFVSKRIRRKGSSSFDVETLMAVETTDMCMVVALMVEEHESSVRPGMAQRLEMRLNGFEFQPQKVGIIQDVDAKDLVSRVKSLKRSLDVSKRRRIDIADLQEGLQENDLTDLRHIRGPTNPLDIGTKIIPHSSQQHRRYLDLVYHGRYEPDLTNAVQKDLRKQIRITRRFLRRAFEFPIPPSICDHTEITDSDSDE